MIYGGDELGRTQGGNNNAYCQDSPTTWYDWTATGPMDLSAFVGRIVRLQLTHPALRRRTFLTGRAEGGALADVTWFRSDGQAMDDASWNDPGAHFLGVLLAGDRTGVLDATGCELTDDDVLLLLNAGLADVTVPLPGWAGARYTVVLDTSTADGLPGPQEGPVAVAAPLTVPARTLIVATSPAAPGGREARW